MNRRFSLVAAFTLIIFLSFLPSSFAIYQWVDENGIVHLTDYPKPGSAPMEKEQEGAAPANAPVKVTPPSEQIKDAALHATALPMKRTEGTQSLPSSAGQPSQDVKSGRPAEPTAPVPAQQARQETVSAETKTIQTVSTGIPATSEEAPSATPAASMPNTAPPPNAVAALVAGFLTFFLFIIAGLYVYGSLCLYLIAKKLNVPAAWTAWIPILQIWALFASAKQSLWMALLFIIPFVNAIVGVYLWICITENLGRNKMLGLLMLVPVVNLIFLGFLAFSKEENMPAPSPAGAF
ncbi:MAG TPA: DUF5684 domain-containing protein [Nitrospirota bacterium]|nr:DUF5684 domain-containing protein [Nitrospirota bacterium]